MTQVSQTDVDEEVMVKKVKDKTCTEQVFCRDSREVGGKVKGSIGAEPQV